MVAFGGIRWGFLMFFGILLISLGIAVMILQKSLFLWFFAVIAIIDGITTIIMAIAGRKISRYYWIYLLVGIISFALGIIAIFWQQIRDMTFVYYVASWAVFIGIFKIAATAQLQKGRSRILPIILGIIAFGIGLFILVDPGLGSTTLFWLVAGVSLAAGTFFIARAVVLRNRIKAERIIRQAIINSPNRPANQ